MSIDKNRKNKEDSYQHNDNNDPSDFIDRAINLDPKFFAQQQKIPTEKKVDYPKHLLRTESIYDIKQSTSRFIMMQEQKEKEDYNRIRRNDKSFWRDYFALMQDFINAYILKNGKDKYDTVHRKVYESNLISGFISKAKYNCQTVDHLIILSYVNGCVTFLLSKPETEALAGLLVLQRWNDEVNSHYQLKSAEELKKTAFYILQRTDTTFLLP
jgi:hypothetical protein